ncbi:hypothetical protein HC028_09090 [Planosporangium flavigriseum]|uniref:Lsr2 DNA-binding domain-containing protein n=1 Tax=Planosporangium flavigriseum TaxID=373681 RepID=A0A8J3PMB1_9ACTN|nr:histone-like nucleoid-structuring protein Lsr2 [Planosporangium flavigriseum]NJC64658.1 hypothetical protein [Planosporangium flavigriseum]GIG74119.1 hypothetical protein Pfl04_25230 [Planosporangium flavigriseum]
MVKQTIHVLVDDIDGGEADETVAYAALVDRYQSRAIREWAQGKGIVVSDRGRIKQEIVDRYQAEAGR